VMKIFFLLVAIPIPAQPLGFSCCAAVKGRRR
jgi:hypothetical protein